MSLEVTTLGDHIELVSGPAFKSAQFTENTDDIPLIKGENIAQGYIAWEKSRYWPSSELKKYERFHLHAGDIVLAMDRPWIPAGLKWSEIQERDPLCLLVQRVARLRASDTLHQRFLKYLIASRDFSEYIKNLMGGTNVPHISGKQIKDYRFLLPDLHTQERIAGVLSAYDDLIENNRRRIALLEEAARLLYREWFVHFRFPGYETAKFVDGLPEGWEQKRLEDVTTKLGSGATPRGGAGAYKASGISLIRSLNVYDRSFHDADLAFIDDAQAKKLANVIVEKDDVLLNITGASVARCCNVPERHLPARVNQHVMIVRADREVTGPFFLMLSLTSHQYKERLLSIARAGGATREALNKTVVENFQVLHPPFEIIAEFETKVSAMIAQVEKLAAANDKLAKARDLLLPRLMDGRLSIPE